MSKLHIGLAVVFPALVLVDFVSISYLPMLQRLHQTRVLTRRLQSKGLEPKYYKLAPSTLNPLAHRTFFTMGSLPFPTLPPETKTNAWQQPGPAAYDFRSDTITTPTASMLTAIENTTLFDDVFLEDPTTTSLESSIAALASHESALLVLSGTMGNQISLRCHLTQPPHSVLCDSRAHILNSEAGGVASLSGAQVMGIAPSNGVYLTLEDIQKHAIISDDIHACPTRVISLENTLSGTIMPLSEVRKISTFARENNIKLHLDGARLWEVVAAGAGSIPEFCECFDSVSLCFSKGLGAPIGSIIVGTTAFIKHARWVRKSIGGGIRMSGVIAAAARTAIDDVFGHGPFGKGGKLKETHVRARQIAGMWQKRGGMVSRSVETNMVWLDLEHAGVSGAEFVEISRRQGLKMLGGRLVVHYQVCDDAVSRLEKVMDEVMSRQKSSENCTGRVSSYQACA
jgi:threonine aldolase